MTGVARRAPQRALELSRSDSLAIFRDFIVPAIGVPAERDRRKQPRLLLVAGQMGAGKSTVIASLAREFPGEPQLIIPDELLEFIPGYGSVARVDSIKAQMAAGATPALWNRWLLDRAIANRNDIVFEAARADVATLREVSSIARRKGYSVDLVVLAAHEIVSWQNIVMRYERMVGMEEIPRFVVRNSHDTAYHSWPGVLHLLENDLTRPFDSIEVRHRHGVVSRWSPGGPPVSCEALIAGRHIPLDSNAYATMLGNWIEILRSGRLSRAFPSEDFFADAEAASDAEDWLSDNEPDGEAWLVAISAACDDAVGHCLTECFVARMAAFKAEILGSELKTNPAASDEDAEDLRKTGP